jgi:hypothetical protein
MYLLRKLTENKINTFTFEVAKEVLDYVEN